MEEIEQELLQGSSESAATSRPNGESLPMLTVEELERKLRGQTENEVPASSLPHSSQPSTALSAVPSSGATPVTRVPGLLPIVPGSIPVCNSIALVRITVILIIRVNFALFRRADESSNAEAFYRNTTGVTLLHLLVPDCVLIFFFKNQYNFC